jgi:putative MATE family efflux protein
VKQDLGKGYFWDKGFYRALLVLALPMALQQLIGTSLQLVDSVMIGQLGEVAMASVNQAGQWKFLLDLVIFGTAGATTMFAAQFWGNRDLAGIAKVQGLMLRITLAVSCLFMAVALFAPQAVLSIFSNDARVIEQGGGYLRILALCFPIVAVTNSYSAILRSTEQVRLPMFCSIMGIVTNVCLNYILIFGKLGLPALGMPGAAIATVIAAGVECALMVGLSYKMHMPAAARLRQLKWPGMEFFAGFMKRGLPVIMNEGIWSLGIAACNIAYGRMGVETVAAMNVAGTLERLCMVALFSISGATAILIGKHIGQGDLREARRDANRLLFVGPALGAVMGVVVILIAEPAVTIYNVSPEVRATAVTLMRILGVVSCFRVFNNINIVGVLRGGGDTVTSLCLDTMPLWFYTVPVAFIGGLALHLPITALYPLVMCEDVIKAALGYLRVRSGKWVHDLTQLDAPKQEELA